MYTPNLPIINQLRDDQSTYITFTKALLDFDKADMTDTEYYFSKMVCLCLPNWDIEHFYADLVDIGIISTNPNLVVPKVFQYYLENILRQDYEFVIDEIAEIAFWKTMDYMRRSDPHLGSKDLFTFANGVVISNFIESETSTTGWCEIVGQIPNKCKVLVPAFRKVENVPNIFQTTNTDTCLTDNGYKQFVFEEEQKYVIDFNELRYNEVDLTDFKFNVILLYYKDSKGVDKLHGINFLFPYTNKVMYWDMETFTQKTNIPSSIGYQFKFNMKTCTNEATIKIVLEQEELFYNLFGQTLGLLNTFLESKMHDTNFLPTKNPKWLEQLKSKQKVSK
jgi:hypothetical protein